MPSEDSVMPQQLTVLDALPDAFTFCTWGNVNIHVWWAPIVEPMVQRLGEFSSATMRQYPGGMSFVHLVMEGTGLPDAEARSALLELAKRFEYDVGPTAVVVGGEGFWAGALRAAVTGLWLAAPNPMPMRMCGNSEEVMAWLPAKHAERTGVRMDASELGRILQDAGRREQSHTTPALSVRLSGRPSSRPSRLSRP